MEKLSPDNFAGIFELGPQEPVAKCLPITIWVPLTHKGKYDKLQEKSGHKFGKFCREILIKTIDSVAAEKDQA